MKAQANWAFSSSGWMLLYLLSLTRALLINHCHPIEQVGIGSLPCAQKCARGIGAYSSVRKPRDADNKLRLVTSDQEDREGRVPVGGRKTVNFLHIGVLELYSRKQGSCDVQHEAQA